MPRRLRFVDLARQEAPLGPRIRRALDGVARRRDFTLGKALTDFERRLASYVGVRDAVGTSSGGAALELMLRALDLGPGDEVIVQANSYIATAFAALNVGAKPVLVDCRAADFQMDPARVEAAVTSRTRAILATHLYGYAAPMGELSDIAKRKGLGLLEDAAQAAGTRYGARFCGALGAAAAFSFYPSKNLGCWGDGGAVTTDDSGLARSIRVWRSYGDEVKNRHTVIGLNARLDTLQAAVLSAKLPALDSGNALRRAAAENYRRAFADLSLLERIILPPIEVPGQTPNFHLFVIQAPRRDALRRHLAEEGIETGLHYPTPIHLQPVMRPLKLGRFPAAEALAPRLLSLPMFAGLTAGDCMRVARSIKRFYD